MSYIDALDIVVARTGHERYRWLCSNDNPDIEQRDACRALIIRQATGQPAAPEAPDPASAALQAHLARHGCCN